ncbi:MAG TPA: DUF1003 domain-containing protein [Rhizomicrobium sp.]|nr:DUF1003 domain-containing protein [Rhizomicrobium sp.]
MNEPGHSHKSTHVNCAVCGQSRRISETVLFSLIRASVAEMIRAAKPDIAAEDRVCLSCHNRYRNDYVRAQMQKDQGDLSTLEQEVLKSIRDNAIIADNLNSEIDQNLTFGERLADHVAEFGGSWKFIILFFTVMAVWVVTNSVYFLWHPFDPYPFILFNLVLSMLAAIQAPIIMMSQNRQASRDRLSAENDYQVNLKAELEIRAIGEKLDLLIHNQWQRLIEIQQVQMEMLEDLAVKRGK